MLAVEEDLAMAGADLHDELLVFVGSDYHVRLIRGQEEERWPLSWVPGGCVLNQLMVGKAPTVAYK